LEEARIRFQLETNEQMLECIPKIGVIEMTNPSTEARCGEWLGIFEDMSQDQ
jgi:hypothetical protein